MGNNLKYHFQTQRTGMNDKDIALQKTTKLYLLLEDLHIEKTEESGMQT